MGILETLQHENKQLRQEFSEFKEFVSLYLENQDDDIKGTQAAAKFAGVSPKTLETERDRPGTPIVYRKVGRSVSYSRKSLIEYKNRKRIMKAA